MLKTKLTILAILLAAQQSFADIGISIAETINLPENCFTQGFVKTNRYFYLSCGKYQQSRLLKLNLTGETLKEYRHAENIFAEGIAIQDQRLLNLSWKEHQATLFNKETLKPVKTLALDGEGWGLTTYNKHWLKSDGSSQLTLLLSENLTPVKVFNILKSNKPLNKINALVSSPSYIIANIWKSTEIIFIKKPLKPSNEVSFTIDLFELVEKHQQQGVLNGVAYDTENNYLWVTGKNWGKAYAIILPAHQALQKTL